MDFYELRTRAGLFNSDVAKLFGVSESTVRRWNASGAPHYVCERLSLIAGCHPSWKGIKILSGSLVTTSGDIYTANEIELFRYRDMLLHSSLALSTELQKRITDVSLISNSVNDRYTVNIYSDIANSQ